MAERNPIGLAGPQNVASVAERSVYQLTVRSQHGITVIPPTLSTYNATPPFLVLAQK